MSLTVASAALDTAWAEFGAVSVTASVLINMSAMCDQVEAKLNRGTLSATTKPNLRSVFDWLTRGKEELAEIKHFTWRRRFVTASTTSGTHRYALPPDYSGLNGKLRDLTNDRIISIIDGNQFDSLYPDVAGDSNDEPLVATVRNLELWLGPCPSGTFVLELSYDRSGDDVDSDSVGWLPEIERFRICDFALGEAFASLEQMDMAGFYFNRWERGLAKATRADGKRKFSQVNYRCRSIFQAV